LQGYNLTIKILTICQIIRPPTLCNAASQSKRQVLQGKIIIKKKNIVLS